MLTIILLVVLAGVVIGAIYLALASGTKGGRHRQSSQSVVNDQRDTKEPPRATGID